MLKHLNIKRFRKFKNKSFSLTSRLNLIAGANGIGKSTLLGIIASGTGTKDFRTINNKNFHPEFDDYFILTKDEHSNSQKSDDYYEVILTYNYKKEIIRKRIRTSHPNQEKLKLVPRTINERGVQNKEYSEYIRDLIGVTDSGRVPIPTIFVSMSRIFPFGESGVSLENISRVLPRKNIHDYDNLINEYIRMYNKILPNSIDKDDITLYETSKPNINYEAFYITSSENRILTQSVGQDSLSGIINAILSFQNISYLDNYPGGLLCIDELDASLHPDAQKRLIKLLRKEADRLNLQVVFSSHSLTIIKEMVRLARKDNAKHSVLYFRNKSNPYPKNEDSYHTIKADLFQETSYTVPKVKVYFEDAEAKFFFKNIINIYENSLDFSHNILSKCDLIVSEISCDTLLKLPNKDDYFKDTIIVLDGDAKYNKPPKIENYLLKEPKGYNIINNIPKNVIFLPGEFSPEAVVFKILYNLCINEDEHDSFWSYVESLPGNYYASIFLTKLEEMKDKGELTRVPFKEWFNSNLSFFTQSDIYKYYYLNINETNVINNFGDKFFRLLENKLKVLQSKGF